MNYILTSENVTDIFTKALPKPKFMEFVGMLGSGDNEEMVSQLKDARLIDKQ